MKTTNYYDTFIEVAEDCPVSKAEKPPAKGDIRTVAAIQFNMVAKHPYGYTSDEVLFEVHAERKGITSPEKPAERERFFSKGQPCFRASPLTKRYGWGVHSNSEGKIAIYPVESEEYERFVNDKSLQHVLAIRSKRV